MEPLVITILAIVLMLTGCGKIDEEKANVSDGTSVADISVANMSIADDAGTEASDNENDASSFISHERYQQAKDDKSGNYTAFLNNEKKAKVDCDDYVFESEEKKEYDFEELKELASDSIILRENPCDSDYRYIDCGCDGEKELLIWVSKSEHGFGFVLKDEGGELYIRYVSESGEKFYEGICEDGYVSGFGKAGASLAIYDYGYLDKDARYHVFYTCQYYLALDLGMAGIEDEDVLNNNQLLVYSFDSHVDAKNEDCMCTDEGFVDTWIKKSFIDDGYKFYSKKELKERMLKRADEIGLSKLDIDEWKEDISREFED